MDMDRTYIVSKFVLSVASILFQNATKELEILGPLRKRLRIRSVISVNYHYITVLCPLNLLIRFKCYNTV